MLECNVGKTMPFLPPMTGNGNYNTYKTGDDWGMVHGIVLLTLWGFPMNIIDLGVPLF